MLEFSWSWGSFLFILFWCSQPILSHGENSHDIFFRNITQILDHLLKDYDSSQHPHRDEDMPTIIRTNILIRSMGPISEHDMDYSLDCYFRQYWRDPRLSFRGPVKQLSLNIKMLELLWRPDTYFHNGKKSYIHTITVPNKLLRINQEGDITYSMRLTIKAKCPMCLRNFPFDKQSCPLIIGSYAYPSKHIVYAWDNSENSVSFIQGMALSQFDLISSHYTNLSLHRKEGEFSALQVNFFLVRHKGFFLIQVYVPCVLIVVLSWVSFWINREATSDRVALGITAVLTLSTISLDSRTDLPKVHYATALDWFLLMSFGYCMATLLEFAGVHYFTKIGSGEIIIDDDGWEDGLVEEEWIPGGAVSGAVAVPNQNQSKSPKEANCPLVFNEGSERTCYDTWRNRVDTPSKSMESKETQTERRLTCFRQFLKCFVGDEEYRRARQRSASTESSANSVSQIDTLSRILFPLSFLILNIFYWLMYVYNSGGCEMFSVQIR